MKLINLLLFNLMLCGLLRAGKPWTVPIEKKSSLLSNKEKHSSILAAYQPPDTGIFSRNMELYQIEKKLHSGKVLTIAGVSMFGGGTLITIAAVAFTNKANNINGNNYNYGYGYSGNGGNATGAITGAVMCYIIGGGCLVASIPLVTIGAIRWNEGKFEKNMYFEFKGTLSPSGPGAKLTF